MAAKLRLQLAEVGADAERLDRLSRLLRRELLEMEVEEVAALPAGPPPPGTRAFEVAAVGGLLVTIGQSVSGLEAIVSAVRQWLARGRGMRRAVRLEISGDVLELSDATAADQEQLVRLFVNRHTAVEGP